MYIILFRGCGTKPKFNILMFNEYDMDVQGKHKELNLDYSCQLDIIF